MSDDFCVNCTRTFEPGEARYQIGNDIVCADCARSMSREASAPVRQRDAALSDAAAHTRGRVTRRPSSSSAMPVIVTLVVTVICSSIVGWMFYTGKLSMNQSPPPPNPNVARFNTLVAEANSAATQGKDEAALQALNEAIRLLDSDPDLQTNADRASLVAQRDRLLVRSGKRR